MIDDKPPIKVLISPHLWAIEDDKERKRRIQEYLDKGGYKAVGVEKPYALCEGQIY